MNEILIDQKVASRKFENEIDSFYKLANDYSEKGWKVLYDTFPFFGVELDYTFKGKNIKFLVLEFDFTNYNIEPIKVKVMFPKDIARHEQEFYLTDLNDRLLRIIYDKDKLNTLLTNHHKTFEPFICLQGTYEYHSHKQHEGDFWDLYRYSGEGKLGNLLYQIWNGSINSYTRKVCETFDINNTKRIELYQPKK